MHDTSYEYAIEVPGRGYLDEIGRGGIMAPVLSAELASWTPDFETASDSQLRLIRHYKQLGCSEIADTVRLLARSVTVTWGDWEPLKADAKSGPE